MLLCLYNPNLGLLFVLLSVCLCFTLHCFCVNKDYHKPRENELIVCIGLGLSGSLTDKNNRYGSSLTSNAVPQRLGSGFVYPFAGSPSQSYGASPAIWWQQQLEARRRLRLRESATTRRVKQVGAVQSVTQALIGLCETALRPTASLSSSSSSSFICQQNHNIVHKVDTKIQLARHTRLIEHLL